MDTWVDIRRKALACHEVALKKCKGRRSARALVAAALKNDDLEVFPYEPGTMAGKNVLGFLDRQARIVHVAKNQTSEDELVVIAHEIGHFKLHQDRTNEVTALSPGLGGESVDSGAGRVEGYSSRERREVQADVFAGEFLCPASWLLDEFLQRDRRPTQIAEDLGLPVTLVLNQFIRALLLPPLRPSVPDAPHVVHKLDDSQRRAATWNDGPLLVDAGPGTGKTRTLVHRVGHLLDQGVSPASILALTFSNKAAEEMRERISAMNADAAIEMWIGTFHAFGREVLTKWPATLGRTSNVHMLDQAGSLAVLEANLQKLPLHHYQHLYEPALELVNVLRAISRCKDELISPDEYLKEAQAALDATTSDDLRLAAEKALEVAKIYRVYEEELQRADAVDFGDLIWHAVTLVENHPGVGEWMNRFKHVLVDEYQDVNFASSRLLRAICARGAIPWVVADERQSIYRFRGAEPSNVARFVDEFGGSRQSLAINYRSYDPVVRTFEAFSKSMGDNASMCGQWNAHRGAGGTATMTVAPTVTAEAEAIAGNITALREAGVPYGEQAILARTHLTLARIAEVLEKIGVPMLYLGDLFERDEIRTLLSLLAIDAEYGGIGLVRVAALGPYSSTREDALSVIHWSRENSVPVIQALLRVEEIDGISAPGRVGLAKLGEELKNLEHASPWTMLTTWLFERSNYLRPLVSANDSISQQKRVAIYHLLKVCAEQLTLDDRGRKAFLNRIRRIESLNQDAPYRAVASEAADMDAVRVMTIHGSKGLEFQAVHLPALAAGYIPVKRQWVRCPPPPTLAHLTVGTKGHDAEEECLFFVALSRARDYLSLSRAERYTSRNANASKFLSVLTHCLSNRSHGGTGESYRDSPALRPPAPRECYDELQLAIYMKCPALYRYETIEGMTGSRNASPYMQFHRCVYRTVGWMERQRQTGETVSSERALAQLASEWGVNGPVGHAFGEYYRAAANQMVRGLAETIAAETATYERPEWKVPIGDKFVALSPDRVVLSHDGVAHVQRIRTGRETKLEPQKPVYALLRAGAAAHYAGQPVVVETFYLATRNVVAVPAGNDAKSLGKYADAIAGIETGRFEPEPNDARSCPSCQCYFACRG